MLVGSAEVLWTARYDYDPGWVLEEHSHNYCQAVYLISGSGRLRLDGADHAIQPGYMMMVVPQVKHGLNAAERVRTLDVKFRVRDRSLAAALRRGGSLYGPADTHIRLLFERIRREGETRHPFYREMCSLHVLELLFWLLRKRDARPLSEARQAHNSEIAHNGDSITSLALRYVQEHVGEPLSVRRLAKTLGYSERGVRQHFQDTLGLSPLQYIKRYRIERARSLIHESDYALKEIASIVGFRSVHHFTRVFHEVAGMSPGAWRERYAQGVRKDININPHFRNVHSVVNRGGASADSGKGHSASSKTPHA